MKKFPSLILLLILMTIAYSAEADIATAGRGGYENVRYKVSLVNADSFPDAKFYLVSEASDGHLWIYCPIKRHGAQLLPEKRFEWNILMATPGKEKVVSDLKISGLKLERRPDADFVVSNVRILGVEDGRLKIDVQEQRFKKSFLGSKLVKGGVPAGSLGSTLVFVGVCILGLFVFWMARRRMQKH